MSSRVRLALFLGVTATTFIGATLLVFIATGFRIDPQNRRIVRVGALAVEVTPLGSVAKLNNGQKKEATLLNRRLFFGNLLPGAYDIEINKEGFIPWEKHDIEIYPNKTTFFPFVALFPASINTTMQTHTTPIEPSYLIPNRIGDFLFFSDAKTIGVLDLKKQFETSLHALGIQKAEWLVDNRTLLLTLLNTTLATLSVEALPSSPLPLPQELKNGVPDPRGEGIFAERILENNTKEIVRFNIRTQQIEDMAQRILSSVFVVTNERLVFIDFNGIAWRSGLDGNGKEQLTVAELGTIPLAIASPKRGGHIAIKDVQGSLWLFDPNTKAFARISESIINFTFSESGDKLLFSTKNEVRVKYLKAYETQPVRTRYEEETVTRFAETLGTAFFYPDNEEHVLVSDSQNGVRVYELDGRGGRNSAVLFPGPLQTTALAQDVWLFFVTRSKTILWTALPKIGILQFGPIGF